MSLFFSVSGPISEAEKDEEHGGLGLKGKRQKIQ